VKEYWVQILKRAALICFWVLFTLFILAGGKLNWFQIDYLRLYGVCMVVSAIVQAFKKPNQQVKQAAQRTYLDVVTELLQGDQNAAIRLFNYNKDKFGGKSDEWLWQKVIRDIERDRR